MGIETHELLDTEGDVRFQHKLLSDSTSHLDGL